MWKVTFLRGRFVVGVFFNRAKTKAEAIKSARLYCVNKFSRASAERV